MPITAIRTIVPVMDQRTTVLIRSASCLISAVAVSGSARTTQLPIASAVPLMPPLGYLMLLAWRLVRPGLLPVWAGFPLGLFDDLFSGQPLGCAMLLWSATMIGIELVETRFPWRGFFQDWIVASVIVTWYIVLAAMFSGAPVAASVFLVLLPQLVLSIALIPLLSRFVASLDRFRLTRVRSLG